MFDVSETALADSVSSFTPGTNVLVAGGSMTGKRALTLRLLAESRTEKMGLLLVMTSESGAVVLEDLGRWYPSLDRDRVAVVDCLGNETRRADVAGTVRSVDSPTDLSTLGVTTTKLSRKLAARGVSTVGHGVISVSTLLRHHDLETVFKFLHIYTQRIVDTDALGVYTFDPTVHDEQTVATITRLFDTVVELRDTDDGEREVRVTGLDDHTPSWRVI